MNFGAISPDIYWGSLLAGMGFLLYTMFSIKREHRTSVTNSDSFHFNDLLLRVPRWWKCAKNHQSEIKWLSPQNRGWFCHVFWKDSFSLSYPEDHHILLDEMEKTQGVLPEGYFSPDFEKHVEKSYRIEGIGTFKGEERVHLSFIVVQLISGKSYYFIEQSSVLTGLIEGPYFELMIKNLEKLP